MSVNGAAGSARRYRFSPGLRLELTAAKSVLGHFDAEYGSAVESPDGVNVQAAVRFGRGGADGQRTSAKGGYKTVRWSVGLSDPDAEPLRASIDLRGRPFSFGLSLVQGYFVEPLLSLAAVRAGYVLLPGAAIREGNGTLLLMGRSGSGKSSLSARACAAGREVLGDDQVLLDPSGRCWPFPRRMRFYSDLAATAPSAHALLSRGNRAALTGRRLVRWLTRGYVAPPIRVRPGELGHSPHRSDLPLARVALIERSTLSDDLDVAEVEIDSAVQHGLDLLAEQRSAFRAASGSAWKGLFDWALEEEGRVLRAAFVQTPVERISVPEAWGAVRAVASLAERLDLEDRRGQAKTV